MPGASAKKKPKTPTQGAATGLELPELTAPSWYRHDRHLLQTGWARRIGQLPGLVGRALALAWQASPATTAATLALNLAAGVFTAVALVATAGVLDELFAEIGRASCRERV